MTEMQERAHMTFGNLRRTVEGWARCGIPDEALVSVDTRQCVEVYEDGECVVEDDHPLRSLSVTYGRRGPTLESAAAYVEA